MISRYQYKMMQRDSVKINVGHLEIASFIITELDWMKHRDVLETRCRNNVSWLFVKWIVCSWITKMKKKKCIGSKILTWTCFFAIRSWISFWSFNMIENLTTIFFAFFGIFDRVHWSRLKANEDAAILGFLNFFFFFQTSCEVKLKVTYIY